MRSNLNFVFFGTPDVASETLEILKQEGFLPTLIVTSMDKPQGRKMLVTPPPVKVWAEENKIPYIQPGEITPSAFGTSPLSRGRLGRDAEFNLFIVIAYGKILPEKIINMPKLGSLNIHYSLLPKYRGASPIAASILNGDKSTGITLMKMALAMDAGPIIAKSEPVTIASSDTTATLAQKLSLVGAQLLNTHLLPYLDGQIVLTAQDDSQTTFVPIIKKENGLIDWHQPAEIIERQTRAYTPWPSAYTFWQGQRLKIISGNLLAETAGQPGQLWVTEDKYPAITTSQGSLKISQIQPEGKSPMSGADWLRGYPALTGAILG